jgi:hypothetical protein
MRSLPGPLLTLVPAQTVASQMDEYLVQRYSQGFLALGTGFLGGWGNNACPCRT